jgi:hypothetical protein
MLSHVVAGAPLCGAGETTQFRLRRSPDRLVVGRLARPEPVPCDENARGTTARVVVYVRSDRFTLAPGLGNAEAAL